MDDLVPDHNHLMHLYALREPGLDVVYHLHPDLVETGLFRLALPNMPAGTYKLYGDIVHANGFAETMVTSIALPAITGPALAGDDATGSAKPWTEAPKSTVVTLPDGYPHGMAAREFPSPCQTSQPVPLPVAGSGWQRAEGHGVLHGHAGSCGVCENRRDSVRAHSSGRFGTHGGGDDDGRSNGHVRHGRARITVRSQFSVWVSVTRALPDHRTNEAWRDGGNRHFLTPT